MKNSLIIICLFYMGTLYAQQPIVVSVWPSGPKESNEVTEEPQLTDQWMQGNNEAILEIYTPESSKNKGIAVIICPGGAYAGLAIDHEGKMMAEWFNTQGITGVVLKYRMPNGHPEIPLTDTRETMRILCRMSEQLKIDTTRIGVVGSSAGGHLASTFATHVKEGEPLPAFAILFYPVITMKDSYTHHGSRQNLLGDNRDPKLLSAYSNELRVSEKTPPTLLLLSDDDKAVHPMNSILFYQYLKFYGIKSSMCIFPVGEHGWGFRDSFKYLENCQDLIAKWIEDVVAEK